MKFKFGKISEINIHDESSWRDKFFITIDIDWAPDHVIQYAHKLLADAGVVSTWFVTHETEMLNQLKQDPLIDLGLHPNFNPLLMQGKDTKGKDAETVIRNIQHLVPETKLIRSHSLTQSSTLLNLFADGGFSHECNMYLPLNSGIEAKPFSHSEGMLRCPHIWEDDLSLFDEYGFEQVFTKLVDAKGLKILGFHPIHIYLNTDKLERYESVKMMMEDEAKLKNSRNSEAKGIEDFIKLFFNN